MNRKVVLIYPNFIIPYPEVRGFNVPQGLLHIGTFIKSKGYDVKIIDTTIEKDYYGIIEDELQNAVCVGVSAMTAQLPNAIEILKKIRTFNREIPVIFGGIHPTLFSMQMLENDWIDYVIIGEGELSFLKLLNVIVSKNYDKLKGIGGIAYKERTGEIKENRNKELFKFSDMPLIDYSLLNPIVLDAYNNSDFIYFPLMTARGCPHRCSFCINTIFREYRIWRAWDTERLVIEIERIRQMTKKRQCRITFMDENTFVNKKRIEKLLDIIEGKNLKFEWYCSARADYFKEGFLDIPFLKRLRSCGLTRISIGIEVGSNKVLDYLNKDISLDDILRTADYCNEANIRPSYSMMIGLPNEDVEDVKKTVALIRELSEKHKSWGIVGPQLFRPYPGCLAYQDCVKAGLREPKSTEEWVDQVKNDNNILDARKLPWIKSPKIVNTVHFYSAIIAVSYLRLVMIFNEYCDMTRKNFLFRIFGLIGIVCLSFIAKLRYRFGFYDFFVEKKIFDKIRKRHLSF